MRRRRALLAATVAALALIVTPGVAAKPIFGVVPQDGGLPTASDLDLMPSGGIGGIRLILHWASIESEPGQYDWRGTDVNVREATARGITPLFFLYGTPEWAAHQDGRPCNGGAECSVYPPASGATREAFANFAAAAVKRYGPGGDFWKAPVSVSGAGGAAAGMDPTLPCLPALPCPPPPPPPPPDTDPPSPTEPPCQCNDPRPIRVWQIWNEQNSPKYFAPRVNVKRYAAILKSTGAAIKSADPGADVVLGGMWGPESAKKVVKPVVPYLERLYQLHGVRPSFDSIALHPYSASAEGALAQVKAARRVVKRAGDRKAGTWITEIGWAAGGPRKNPYVKGLGGQARLLSRALSAFKSERRRFRLRGVYWYSWRDKAGGSAICDWCGDAGLRAVDGSAKPAWRAFARVARQ